MAKAKKKVTKKKAYKQSRRLENLEDRSASELIKSLETLSDCQRVLVDALKKKIKS